MNRKERRAAAAKRAVGRGGRARGAVARSVADGAELFAEAVNHHRSGRLGDAVVGYLKAIELKPDFPEAHNNLGLAFQYQGNLERALGHYRSALDLKPDFPEAHYNLGNVVKQQGHLDDAVANFQRAVDVKPNYPEAHNNLGVVLKDQRRLDEAAVCFRRALDLKPDFPEAHNNLGAVLRDQDLLEEALACYRRALAIKTDSAEALFNLGQTFCDLDDLHQAAVMYQKALKIDHGDSGMGAAINLAVLHYLDGNLEQCRRELAMSQPILGKAGLKYKYYATYWVYLDRLLSLKHESDQSVTAESGIEALYVIGESHALSAHGGTVHYNEREMKCAAEWISGCKQWHLGNGKANKYKRKFESVMARLPRGSTILLTIGEIDCRPDEGIIEASKKHPDRELSTVMQATVDSYIEYVAAIQDRHCHQLIVSGVPCTNISLDVLTATDAEQLVHLIRIFNERLKARALAAGMDFLDVHALTDRGDGIARGDRHIDEFHLLPSTVVEAFDRYLVRADAPPPLIE